MKKLAVLLLSSLFITGCVSSQVKDYSTKNITGGEVSAHAIKRLAIRVNSPSDVGVAEEGQKALIDQLKPYGVEVMLWNDIMPPLREYKLDEQLYLLRSNKLDAFLDIGVGASRHEDRIMGAIANTSSYGGGSIYNNNYSYSGNSTTTISPIRKVTRDTKSIATLYSSEDGSVQWKADSETNAGGLLFMSDGTTASSMVSNYLDALKNRGFLIKPEKADKRETSLVQPTKIATAKVVTHAKSSSTSIDSLFEITDAEAIFSAQEECIKQAEKDFAKQDAICTSSGVVDKIEDTTIADKLKTNYLNDQEVAACTKVASEALNCIRTSIVDLKKIDKGTLKETIKKMQKMYVGFEDVISELLTKKITVGEFNKEMFNIYTFEKQ